MERESQLKSGRESGGFSFRLDQFELEPCDKFEYGPFLCRARRTFRPSPDCGQINRELQWCLTVVLCSHFYDEIMSGIDPYYSSLPLLLVQGCSLTVYRYCSYWPFSQQSDSLYFSTALKWQVRESCNLHQSNSCLPPYYRELFPMIYCAGERPSPAPWQYRQMFGSSKD